MTFVPFQLQHRQRPLVHSLTLFAGVLLHHSSSSPTSNRSKITDTPRQPDPTDPTDPTCLALLRFPTPALTATCYHCVVRPCNRICWRPQTLPRFHPLLLLGESVAPALLASRLPPPFFFFLPTPPVSLAAFDRSCPASAWSTFACPATVSHLSDSEQAAGPDTARLACATARHPPVPHFAPAVGSPIADNPGSPPVLRPACVPWASLLRKSHSQLKRRCEPSQGPRGFHQPRGLPIRS